MRLLSNLVFPSKIELSFGKILFELFEFEDDTTDEVDIKSIVLGFHLHSLIAVFNSYLWEFNSEFIIIFASALLIIQVFSLGQKKTSKLFDSAFHSLNDSLPWRLLKFHRRNPSPRLRDTLRIEDLFARTSRGNHLGVSPTTRINPIVPDNTVLFR